MDGLGDAFWVQKPANFKFGTGEKGGFEIQFNSDKRKFFLKFVQDICMALVASYG